MTPDRRGPAPERDPLRPRSQVRVVVAIAVVVIPLAIAIGLLAF